MDMETGHIKGLLKDMGKNCFELADKLGDKGTPLSIESKQLIRFAACPILDDVAKELKSAFLSGQKAWVESSLGALTNQIMPFMD